MKQNYQRKNWLFLIPSPKGHLVGHLEKFGYEWNKEGFKYEIKIKNNKIIKKLTLERQKRIDFNVDSSRIFNTQPNASNGIISFSMGYLENISLLKKYLKYLVKYLILLACQF